MDGIETEELLSATLYRASADSSGEGVPISTVVDRLSGSGQRLSRQVEFAVAVETLVARGLVQRETTDDGDRLVLTDEGRAHASDVFERLAQRHIEVAEGDDRREMTVSDAAAAFDRSPVGVLVDCSADGVYYGDDRVEDGGIVGREVERERFEAVLDRVRESGDGEVLRLVGPGGNGKTELANAFLAATPEEVETVQLTSREAESEPFQLLRDAFAQLGVENPIEAGGFDVDDADAFEAQQTGLFTDITRSLTPDSGTRVLVFDDVNRADRATWEYLADLSERLADRSLVVVLSHRPGTIPEDASIHPEAGLEETCIELTGLDWEETRRLIQQVVGRRSVPDDFGDAVQERTGGTPLFVETTVQTLLETGQIDPDLGRYPTDPEGFDLPEAATETIQRQTDALEGDVREILEWVAVAGGYVPMSLVADAAEDTPGRVRTVLDTVTGTGLLDQEARDDERWVTFRNEVFGDALADRLAESEREHRHETIARLLEGTVPDGDSDQQWTADRAATIGYHHERSGDLGSAIEWYEDAADRATDVYAHETAVEYYYRVIEIARLADDIGRVLSANEQLAEIYTTTGEYEQATKHCQFVRERADDSAGARSRRTARLAARIHNARGEYDEAIEAATAELDSGDASSLEQCRLHHVLAQAHIAQSNYERARETAQRQRDLAKALDSPALEADARRVLGGVARREGTYEQATAHHEHCLDIAREIGDRNGEAESLRNLGAVAWSRSEYDRAREYFERSLVINEKIGNRQGMADSINNLGNVAWVSGKDDRGREYYERSLESYRNIGDRHGEAKVLNNLGSIGLKQGDRDRAHEYFEQSLESYREIGDRNGEAKAQHNLGALGFLRGAYDQARELLTESLAIKQEIGVRSTEAKTLNELGKVAFRQGDYDRARELLTESLAIKQDIGDRDGEAKTLCNLGDLTRGAGHREQAREYYEHALDRAREHGFTVQEALGLRGLCAIERQQVDSDRASDHVERALTLIEESGTRSEIAQVRLEGGKLALARSDIDTARQRIETASETFEEIAIPYWYGRSRQLLGTLEHQTGKTATAREHLKRAVDTFEEIGAVADTLQTLELLVDLCQETGDETAEEWSQHAVAVLADAPEATAEAHGEWVDRQTGTSGDTQ